MALSNDLVSQFVKATKDTDNKKRNTTVYGTVVVVSDQSYVKLDGSDMLTPISTITDLTDGDRVMVSIDKHAATVTGNVTSPSARFEEVQSMGTRVEANEADINNLYANRITTDYLKANYAEIGVLDAAKARITDLEVRSANIEELKADKAEINELDTKYASIDELDAVKANITSLDAKYVNINYTNIDEASIKKFYAKFGMMEDVTISNGTVTGKLVGVTINGDLIQAGTLVADKLVIKTEDGLLYKLNAEALGEAGLAEIEDLETLKEGLHGAIINDKTIVAEKIKVDDLVAFGATIGGFKIDNDSIHSVVKESVDNTTRGIYMDNNGKLNVGDAFNFIKFYEDADGNYKLAVSADEVAFGSSRKNLQTALDEVAKGSISGVDVEYYKSISATELAGGSWSTTTPEWENGKYIWSRTKTTSASNNISYSDPVCITGNTGAAGTPGKDGTNGTNGKDGIDGAPGEQGVGVSSIVEQYCSSTSEVEPPGDDDDWDDQQPTWSPGNYIWTRSFITWSDDSTSTTAPVLAHAINEANANANRASDDADKANAAADDAKDVADKAYSEISKLNDSIKNLVVGKDGSTLMTQTDDGWQFNFGIFKDTLDDIGKKTAYVNVDETNEGNPKIELGKMSNDSKVAITNEEIQFVVGSEIPTKVNNKGIDTDQIQVDNEIRVGSNFVWKVRANGNLGLSWKGAGS